MYLATHFRADQLVFVDESACNRHTPERRTAWAPCSEHARRHCFFVRGEWYVESLERHNAAHLHIATRYSVLPALSLDGILHLDVQKGSYNTICFNEFVGGLLDHMNPFPHRNSVIVMDNTSAHKSDDLRDYVEARYVMPCIRAHCYSFLT